MDCSYYTASDNQLIQNARIPIQVLGDANAVFFRLALEMVTCIEENNVVGKRTVFICPVGPVGHYPFFVDLVNLHRTSLKNCWFFNMDEYLEDDLSYIDIDHKLSFRGFMKKNVYNRINPDLLMPASQRIFPDPSDPKSLDVLLDSLGGADIAFGGIGINGHLAFNEPDNSLSAAEFAQLPTRIQRISAETRTSNAISDCFGAIEIMPKMCITIGMKDIMVSKKVRLGVFRDWHRAVIRRTALGEVSSAFPASLLQNHPDAIIYATDNIAGKIR